MTDEIVLRTQNLRKEFGAVRAVDGIDLAVRRGRVTGFLGPNGAGKTTTIGMVLGLIHPSAGRVELFGQPVGPGRNGLLRRVGSLVGAPALLPYLSARDNLRLLARLHPGVSAARIEEVLAQLDLTGAAGRRAGKYSSGMKQRLGLAMALLARPELLVLDEPTNGMDPAGMREMRDLLRELANQGVTVFLSSHLLHEVEQICDEVVVLHRGRIVAQGAVAELLGRQAVVRVRVPAPPAAVAVLAQLPGVTGVEPNGNLVTVRGLASEEIVLQLVQHGIVPSEVTSGRGDLESLFIELTGEARPDAQGAEA
jgi:ABC-2 type transport system ATP-binding protein